MPIETYLCDSPAVFHSLADGHIAGHTVVPPSDVIWGVGGTNGSPSDYWLRQGTNTPPNGLHARTFFAYNSSAVASPTWTTWGCNNVPVNHDIWFQTKGTTRASFDATLATFPGSRGGTGRVFLFYFNEPEDDMSAATYISRVNDLYAAIDAAGLSYVVKAQELNAYKLRPVAAFDSSGYVHPDTRQFGWSCYGSAGSAKIVGGHVVPQLSPEAQTNQIVAFMQTNAAGVPWGAAAWGMSIPDAYWADATSHANRLAWAQGCAPSLVGAGCTHLCWYDYYQSAAIGDYRIAQDPDLLAWWLDPSNAGGQTA